MEGAIMTKKVTRLHTSETSLEKLAQLMRARQEQKESPYVLLLGSSLSLTPAVRRALARTEDWEAFWKEMQRISPTERKTLLKRPLDALGLEPGYQAVARLAKAGYFNLILTLNVDDAIDDAVRPLPADQSVLLVHDGSNATQIVEALSRPTPRLKVIKLRGDINAQALPLTDKGQFEFPNDLERSVSEWLRGDTILVGDIPYDTDLQRCINQSTGALWCILPDEPVSNSFIVHAKQIRSSGKIITGADAEFNTFFTAMAKRLPTKPKPQRSPQPKQPPTSQRIPFTNREDEIKLVLSSFAPAYYLLDAPAGYGKTELLKELERRFQEPPERNWRCAYVSIEEQSTLADLVTKLAGKLDVTPAQDPELPWGWRLGGALQRQWENAPKEGLALLIDLEKRPALSLLKELLEEFIPAIQDSLRALEFFEKNHNRFRVILAGRYLAASKEIRAASLQLKDLRLTPFDYSVIRDSAGEYLAGHKEDGIKQLAAHLVYLSGGHPGCIAQILEMYKKMGVIPDTFLKFFGKRIWRKIVCGVVDDVRSEIPEGFKGFHKVLDRLSVFRYLDSAILKRIIEEDKISEVNSGHNLADKLTATYLFTRKGRFLRDDITRRLLAIRLRHEMPEEFLAHCQKAQKMCADRMQEPNVQRPEMWVIEYLFQSLQQHANTVQDKNWRRTIREEFFKDVSKALQMFVKGIPPEKWEDEQYAVNQAMEEDWEFRFTVNYYLREDQYSDEPYNELQRQIDCFFAQKQESGR
jgi:hypothetical protein